MQRLTVLALLKMVLGCLVSAADRPNIILIFTDDQGYEDVGCFGSKAIKTPHLDRLAAEGMKFTHFYAQPICGPSRGAIMTGCYPLRLAERGNLKNIHPVLHEKEITIAEVLRDAGYATGCVGKWDLAGHSQTAFQRDLMPNKQGFDFFFGTPSSNDRSVNLYRNAELVGEKVPMATLTRRYTDEAIGFMKRSVEANRPFFLYLPHSMPHTKLAASGEFKGKSARGLYGDVVEEIDAGVGRIVAAVDQHGLRGQTLIVFTSDNGPWLLRSKGFVDGALDRDHGGSAGPLRSGKVSTWEGGVRVPTIVWAPGRVPEGRVCDRLATTMDLFPTFAKLAGGVMPKDRVIDGRDIGHLLAGRFDEADEGRAYYYYLLSHLQAVRQGPWKLHLSRPKAPDWLGSFKENGHLHPDDRVGFAKPVLYHLIRDPGEKVDLAAENPAVVERLLALAAAAREDIGDYNRVGGAMRFFDPPEPRPDEVRTVYGSPSRKKK